MRRLTHTRTRWVLIMSSLAGAASCTEARRDRVGTPSCVSWTQEVGALFAARCGSCHAGPTPGGGYDTTSYAGVLAGGSDATPNAVAGDASSRLLTALAPASADATHASVGDVFPTARRWVVDCDVSYVRSSVHRPGLLDPTSPDFHGKLVRAQKYDFAVCAKCHGQDFSGGAAQASCLGCHAKGPTDCSTCHASIASSGSHAHHLGGGPMGKTFACGECHVVPEVYTDVGHIFLAGGLLDPPPAEVTLGATAALTPPGTTRAAAPGFDAATQSCGNVYCHGALFSDGAATHTHPTWNAPGTGQADCGTCHGVPPNHVNATTACAGCHASVVDQDGKIIAANLHIDGKVELADAAAGCAGCHGGMANPAPPRDLAGEGSPTAPGVGAHQAHLTGAAHLRGPVACNECHLVPTDVGSAGHLSGHVAGADLTDGAEVFPAVAGVGVLASSDGAAPHWDPATVSCGGVYCHGGGTKLAADTATGVDRAPVWTAAHGLACGSSCHGLPPAFSPHLPTMTRADCASCHSRTVDPLGLIIISGPPGAETSAHINGVLDVAP